MLTARSHLRDRHPTRYLARSHRHRARPVLGRSVAQLAKLVVAPRVHLAVIPQPQAVARSGTHLLQHHPRRNLPSLHHHRSAPVARCPIPQLTTPVASPGVHLAVAPQRHAVTATGGDLPPPSQRAPSSGHHRHRARCVDAPAIAQLSRRVGPPPVGHLHPVPSHGRPDRRLQHRRRQPVVPGLRPSQAQPAHAHQLSTPGLRVGKLAHRGPGHAHRISTECP